MSYTGMEEDRRYITRSAEELAQYFSSDVLLWRMSGIHNPLCPGNVLLTMRKLSIEQKPAEEASIGIITELIEKRQIAWDKKVMRELPMRVNQWQELVDDYHRNNAIDGSYRYNIRVRVIIKLLMHETRFLNDEMQNRIENADKIVTLLGKPGDFVWDKELERVFPLEDFPYLYFEQAGRL